jgi:hypothetical protein
MGSWYFGEVIDMTKSQAATNAQMFVSGDVGLLWVNQKVTKTRVTLLEAVTQTIFLINL